MRVRERQGRPWVVAKPGYSGGGAIDLAGLGLLGALAALATVRKRRAG